MSTILARSDDTPTIADLAREARISSRDAVLLLELDPDVATGEPLRPRVAAIFRAVLASQLSDR